MKKRTSKRPPEEGILTVFARRAMQWIGSVPSLIFHTCFFIVSFSLVLFGVDLNSILLVVTTIVSLEAVYMAIFIQMALNQNTQSLAAVEEDIDEIQEDVEEIQEDVEEIEKDIDDIQEDVDEIEKDIDVLQQDIDEEEAVHITSRAHLANRESLEKIEARLAKLLTQLEKLKDEAK